MTAEKQSANDLVQVPAHWVWIVLVAVIILLAALWYYGRQTVAPDVNPQGEATPTSARASLVSPGGTAVGGNAGNAGNVDAVTSARSSLVVPTKTRTAPATGGAGADSAVSARSSLVLPTQ